MEPKVHVPLIRTSSTFCGEINIFTTTSDYLFEEIFLQESWTVFFDLMKSQLSYSSY